MMPSREDDKPPRTPEERLRTITGLMVDFFEGDRSRGPCLASIDESLKRIARALEAYAGWVGVASRIERMETGMELVSSQMSALLDTLSENVIRAREVASHSAEKGS